MKIIYDIKDATLNAYLKKKMNDSFPQHIEMTYSQIGVVDYIFKSIESINDINEMKQYPIISHQLIALVHDEKMIVDLLHIYPLCFIRKSDFHSDLQQCLSLLQTIGERHDTILSFAVRESFVRIRSSHIYYIEAFLHYLMIYTCSGNYMIRHTIKAMNQKLEKERFMQVHRSYIVNKAYIQEISKDHLVLFDGTMIPVGRKYRQQMESK